MIPLKQRHFKVDKIKYPVLTTNTSKFLITYWYGRTKVLYDDFAIKKKEKTFFRYINSYEIFIRALYASGIENSELKKFILDFVNEFFNYLLVNKGIKFKKESKKRILLTVYIYHILYNNTSDLKNQKEIIIEKLLSSNRLKDKEMEAWYKVILNRNDVSVSSVSDPILISLLMNDYNSFENSLYERIENSKSRALKAWNNNKESEYFLAQSIGFYDYSFEILKEGYIGLFKMYNS